jgi:3-methylfumaryl-CoA hydratase
MSIDDLQAWVGRERFEDDVLTLFPARGMTALLDRDPGTVKHGSPLPLGWHWLYFKPLTRQSDLGDDGHERRGAFLPPVPLPRRMWAGGRMRFHAPLTLDEPVERISTIDRIEEKRGRSGALVFVDVRHRVSGSNGVAVDEVQTLVYREPAARDAHAPESRPAAGARSTIDAPAPLWSDRFEATEAALFRFSALTFNGHRIHYDNPYAIGVEGHAGIVVHAPLLALLLLDAATRNEPGRTPTLFDYRATQALYAPATILLEADAPSCSTLRARADGGPTAMTAAIDWSGDSEADR